MIINTIITIIVFYFVYYYLEDLKKCSCVNQTYVYNLKKVQQIFLGMNVIILLISTLLNLNFFPSMKTIEKHLLKGLVLSGILMICFYAYITYNTYYFYSTMGANCECANKWQKYYLYYDAMVGFTILLSTTLVSVMGLVNYTQKKIR